MVLVEIATPSEVHFRDYRENRLASAFRVVVRVQLNIILAIDQSPCSCMGAQLGLPSR